MSHSNPYHLFTSLRSPFARRIRLVMKRLKLDCKETMLDVFQHNPALLTVNPLGMVPTLVFPNHGPVADSATILEVLEEETGAIWPKDFNQRIEVRKAAALVEGIMLSSALFFQETKMHEVPSPGWAHEHVSSIQDTLDFLSHAPSFVWYGDGRLTQAGWDLAVAIEYAAFRIPEINWKKYAIFVAIVDQARKDSYFVETTPKA